MTQIAASTSHKRPESVLVVVYTVSGKVLLLERRDRPGFWQSVTGSLDWEEHNLGAAAARELKEETGIDAAANLRPLDLQFCYEIFPEWRHRYAPDVTHNVETVYALELEADCAVQLSDEHERHGWFDFADAAAKAASWSNRCAIERLARECGSPQPQAVVLVHGLWLSGWAMALLARRLRRAGFHTYSYSYASVGRSLRENADGLQAFVNRIDAKTVHLVGHSLGGVIIQTMLEQCAPGRRGRVVTLGSPHRGSVVAVAFARRGWGRRLLGKSINDVIHRAPPAYERDGRDVGAIKGTRSLGLGRFFVAFETGNDGVVTTAEASWPAASDELEMRVAHTEMLWSRQLARHVENFLKHGRFAR